MALVASAFITSLQPEFPGIEIKTQAASGAVLSLVSDRRFIFSSARLNFEREKIMMLFCCI